MAELKCLKPGWLPRDILKQNPLLASQRSNGIPDDEANSADCAAKFHSKNKQENLASYLEVEAPIISNSLFT